MLHVCLKYVMRMNNSLTQVVFVMGLLKMFIELPVAQFLFKVYPKINENINLHAYRYIYICIFATQFDIMISMKAYIPSNKFSFEYTPGIRKIYLSFKFKVKTETFTSIHNITGIVENLRHV